MNGWLSDFDQEIGFCFDCSLDHRLPARLRRLKKLLPATIEEIRFVYPCTYNPGNGEDHSRSRKLAMLYRDLHRLHARVNLRYWYLPVGTR